MTPRDRLATLLPPGAVDALEAFVAERVEAALSNAPTAWLTIDQSAARLGCSPDAVRKRVARGRLDTRRHGRRVYVSAASVGELAPNQR